jgi:hypothetical protein
VKRTALAVASSLVLGGLAAGAALLFTNLDRVLVLDVYLVYLGAVVLQALARSTGGAARPGGPSAFEEALRPRRATEEQPERLLRIRSLVSLATATAGDFHHGLRPVLREAAAHALSARHGLDLDADAERAAEALGPEAWHLLAAARPAPTDRFAPGPSPAELARAVGTIERIAP